MHGTAGTESGGSMGKARTAGAQARRSGRHQVGGHKQGWRCPRRGDLGVAAGIPQQVSCLRYLMRGVELPVGEVISHVLGEAAEKKAEKKRSRGLVLRQQGEHRVYQYQRPAVPSGGVSNSLLMSDQRDGE